MKWSINLENSGDTIKNPEFWSSRRETEQGGDKVQNPGTPPKIWSRDMYGDCKITSGFREILNFMSYFAEQLKMVILSGVFLVVTLFSCHTLVVVTFQYQNHYRIHIFLKGSCQSGIISCLHINISENYIRSQCCHIWRDHVILQQRSSTGMYGFQVKPWLKAINQIGVRYLKHTYMYPVLRTQLDYCHFCRCTARSLNNIYVSPAKHSGT